jgi:hypothetical protein
MKPLIDYITTYDPSFAIRIRGSAMADIVAFEQLVGTQLPGSYRQFLSAMGEDDGGLHIVHDGTSALAAVVQAYRQAKGRYVPAPPGHLLIGLAAPPAPDVTLDIGSGASEPAVWFAEDGTPLLRFADSLPKLLFRVAFATFRQSACEHTDFLVGADARPQLADAVQMARTLGFASTWFSDSVEFCGERGDAAVAIAQYDGNTLGLRLAANIWSELQHLVRRFAEQLDLSHPTHASPPAS